MIMPRGPPSLEEEEQLEVLAHPSPSERALRNDLNEHSASPLGVGMGVLCGMDRPLLEGVRPFVKGPLTAFGRSGADEIPGFRVQAPLKSFPSPPPSEAPAQRYRIRRRDGLPLSDGLTNQMI